MEQSEIYLVIFSRATAGRRRRAECLAGWQLECATRARNCAPACQVLYSSRVESELAQAEMPHARAGLTAAASNVVVAL